MSAPPEITFAPHTQTEQLEHTLTRALHTITDTWPHMLPTGPPPTRPGGNSATARITADDHARTDADIDPLTRIVSLRREILDLLAQISIVIIRDRPITQTDAMPIPDLLGMATFVKRHTQWFSGHQTAPNAAVQLDHLANQANHLVNPKQREWITLGECPLPGDTQGTPCAGTIRAWPRTDDRDGEVMARCRRCGTEAVPTWWEARMFTNPELREWLTDTDLVTFIHATYGRAVKEATIRQWVKRGVLTPSGTNDKGRRLFHREAVIYALDLNEQRKHNGN